MMFKKPLLSAAAFMIAFVAASGVSPFSLLFAYEPDAPDCLKKEL